MVDGEVVNFFQPFKKYGAYTPDSKIPTNLNYCRNRFSIDLRGYQYQSHATDQEI